MWQAPSATLEVALAARGLADRAVPRAQVVRVWQAYGRVLDMAQEAPEAAEVVDSKLVLRLRGGSFTTRAGLANALAAPDAAAALSALPVLSALLAVAQAQAGPTQFFFERTLVCAATADSSGILPILSDRVAIA
jgi:hypothetical protein